MNSFLSSYFRLLGIGLLVVAFSMPVVRSFADADPGVGVPVGCGTCDLGCKDGAPVWVPGYRSWTFPFPWVPAYWNCGGACHSTGTVCVTVHRGHVSFILSARVEESLAGAAELAAGGGFAAFVGAVVADAVGVRLFPDVGAERMVIG